MREGRSVLVRCLLLATDLAASLSACAALPDQLYAPDTPPVALVGIEEAGLVDLRGSYRAAVCARLPAEGPACDDILLRLAGEPPAAAAPANTDLTRRFRIAFVPGLFAECFDPYARTFGDAQKELEAQGFSAAYFQLPGRGSAVDNADRLAEMLAAHSEDARPFVIFAHSKGLVDVLEMLLRHPETARNIAAIVGVAGAANGSPLASELEAFYRAGVAGFPFLACDAGDGRELLDLEKQRRLVWWQAHREDIRVPLFSLVATPQPDSISPLLRFSYDRLARIDPRNDGKLIWYDQIAPQSHLLGYVNADHWTIAVPAYQEVGALEVLYEDLVPRPVLIRAAIEVVAASLAGG